METNKITNNLKSFLQKNQSENNIEVVIELTPIKPAAAPENLNRNQKMENLKKAFNSGMEPVAQEISNQGGNIVNSVWLNQTIKATVPANSIGELAKLKEVNAIDLPNLLSTD